MSTAGKHQEPISDFTPLSFGGCALWLDATSTTNFALTGSNITAWYDRSPFSNHATPSNGTPVLSNAAINGRPAVYLSNAPSFHGSVSLTNAGVAGFMVVRPLTTGIGRNDQRLFSGSVPGGTDYDGARFFIGIQGNSTELRWHRGGGPLTQTNINALTNYIVSWNEDSASNAAIFLNGATADITASGTSGDNWDVSRYAIGNQVTATTEYFNGFVGEVIVYNDSLTVTQRQAVEGYLAWKWGIAPALGTTFSPLTSLSNCAVWFDGADASTFTLSGSNITQWRDKAGSNVTSNIGTPVYVSNAINGVPGVLLNANAGFKISPMSNAANTTTVSIYGVVAAGASPQNNARIFTSGRVADGQVNNDYSATTSWTLFQASSATPTLTFGHANAYLYASNTLSNGVPCLISAIFSGTTMTLWANGSNMGSNNTTDTFTFDRLGIGKNTNPDAGSSYDAWMGNVGEFLIFYAAHTEAQRLQVESYLASKWNIPMRAPLHLVPTHAYTTRRPFLRDFLPTDIPSCAFWLDAGDRSTLTLSASNTVTAWTDKSKDRRAVTVVSAPTYSSNGFNGLPTLQFTSGQYLSSTTATTFSNAYTIFQVAQTTGSGYQISLVVGGTVNPFVYWWRGDFNSYAQNQEGVGGQGNDRYTATNVPMLHSCVVNSNSPYWNYYTNGIKQINPNLGGYGTAPLSNLGGSNVYVPGTLVQFGGPAGGGFAGNISEVILFSNALTNPQRLQVESYLATKWGLRTSFPAVTPHPFKYGPWGGAIASAPAGCMLWLDAADASTFTLSGSNITQWRDKSGNGLHFSTVSGSPTYSSNIVTFPTGVVMRSAASIALTTNTYVFIATKLTTGGCMLLAFDNIQPAASAGDFSIRYFNDVLTPINAGDFATSYTINGVENTVSTASTYLARHIVGARSQTAGTTTVTLSSSLSSRFYIGEIYEVLMFTSPPSTTVRQQVEGYLAAKWGLSGSLNVSHPYRTGPQISITPTNIPGCTLWLDAADSSTLTLSGSNVTQWADKSGSGRNAVAQTAATYDSSALGLRFSGSNYYSFNNFSFAVGSNFSFFFAERVQSGTNDRPFVATDQTGVTNACPHIVLATPNGPQQVKFAYWGNDLFLNGIFTYTTAAAQPILIWSFLQTSTGRAIYLNGRLLTSDTNTTLPSAWPTPLLGRSFSANYYNGFMHEIIAFGGSMGTAQRQQIEGYLAWKWGQSSALPGSVGDWVGLYRPLTAEFDPRSIGGCGTWFDAADATTIQLSSGSNIQRWFDKAGGQFHLTTNSTGGNFPTLTPNALNGRPVVTFNGASGMLGRYVTPTTTTPQTMFVVARPSATTGNRVLVQTPTIYTTPGPNFAMSVIMASWTSTWMYSAFYGANNGISNALSPSTTRTDIIAGSWRPSTMAITVNGTEYGTSTETPALLATRASNNSMMVIGGGWYFPDNYYRDFYSGYIAEILIFQSFLTNADRQRIEGYLAWKWGLQSQLPALHPYASTKF